MFYTYYVKETGNTYRSAYQAYQELLWDGVDPYKVTIIETTPSGKKSVCPRSLLQAYVEMWRSHGQMLEELDALEL